MSSHIDQPLAKSIFVTGSGRSGTTWLIEMMNLSGEYHIIFEPFAKKLNPECAIDIEKPYLRSEDDYPFKDQVYKFLSGNVTNEWVDKIKSSNRQSNKLLVKDIRLNAALGWIQTNFPDLKIVYIVRDPFSVAFSAAERGWGKALHNAYLKQSRLVKDHLEKQLPILNQADTLFQKGVAVWCIENYMVLKNALRNEMITSVFYETAVREPDAELSRLALFCGHTVPKLNSWRLHKRSTLADRRSVTKPSSQKFGRRWEGQISQADTDYANEVIESFGLTKLYPERNQPGYSQPLDLIL